MYNQNFRNQAVKEVKNGSSIASTARKFDIAINTLNNWVDKYNEKMYGTIREEGTNAITNAIVKPVPVVTKGIKLQSIKVLISGAVVTLRLNDVLKMLNIFNIFNERVGEE